MSAARSQPSDRERRLDQEGFVLPQVQVTAYKFREVGRGFEVLFDIQGQDALALGGCDLCESRNDGRFPYPSFACHQKNSTLKQALQCFILQATVSKTRRPPSCSRSIVVWQGCLSRLPALLSSSWAVLSCRLSKA